MGYLAIPRKYRPSTFKEVIGQEHITETIKNAIKTGKVAHAYIFAGPRGVGKTTTARIIAKALNCQSPVDGEPCNNCSVCESINKGSFPDVIEIDAASNRGIDQIRELRETVFYSPAQGKYKVYIIDEFHMLTKEAFNALLKTLEEPPSHVVFILATTELDKIPATILSRCQRFFFKKVPEKKIVETLANICDKEGVNYEAEALKLIAVASEGCLRDAESLLDQLIALSSGNIKTEIASKFLGVLGKNVLKELIQKGFEGDRLGLHEILEELDSTGYNPSTIIRQLLKFVEEEFINENSDFSEDELTAAYEILSKNLKIVDSHPFPFTALLFSLYKLSYFKEIKKLSELLNGKDFEISTVRKDEFLKKNSKLNDKEKEINPNEKGESGFNIAYYIKEKIEQENHIQIIPKNGVAYDRLSEIQKELENQFGKKVLIIKPENGNKRLKEVKLDEETEKKVDKIISLFHAKIVPGYPRREK
ncbi:DNA polymerase III subunit gamma/tau [Desulfurobacterium atlanticum]|uniref:DNA polymerase III subunit gamma/tau n=1 Tax=Desulfurobacterium atlanticum TaxID=240169 RepID=A0A238Z3T8_9BACT|nr:DNA polymerase III subunit gamma/tau [Desulfurobacterium atlanticum]SNR77551.1 DNA polymerase-3 subunit gamma/tau [Desulfurobacterium atlanticum]